MKSESNDSDSLLYNLPEYLPDYEGVLSSAARLSFPNNKNASFYICDDIKNEGNDVEIKQGCSPKNLSRVSRCLSEKDFEHLLSLPSRIVHSFPTESDRKRIVGCLATIISTMYDYETHMYESCKDNSILRTKKIPTIKTIDEIDNGRIIDKVLESEMFDSVTTTKKESKYRRRKLRRNVTDSLESIKGSYLGENKISSQRHWYHDESMDLRELKRSQNIILNRKCCSACESSSNHHHRRRYSVYAEFLLSAADLLFLDKSNAIAFLPLLNSLCDCVCDTNVQASDNKYESFPKSCSQDHNKKQLKFSSLNNVEINKDTKGKLPLIINPVNKDPWNCLTYAATVNNTGNITKIPCFVPEHPMSGINNFCTDKTNVQVINVLGNEITSPFISGSSIDSLKDDNGFEMRKMNDNLQTWDNNDLLRPFVQSLTQGSGFQCLSLLLLNHLLQSKQGYDARIRHVIKKLAVVVLVQEMMRSDYNQSYSEVAIGSSRYDMLASRASRKYEQLEHVIAAKLIHISRLQLITKDNWNSKNQTLSTPQPRINRQTVLRGLKIGSAGVVAGTLFAVTGGLAAPGIAAGLAALGTTTAATASVMSSLTSTAAVTTIFGVGGGSLAAYKTHRRTRGVTEFEIEKETFSGKSKGKPDKEVSELFSTVCLSGWLRDMRDFQRPWGVIPRQPCMDRAEKLFRFYTIYNPENVNRTDEILRTWKGKEKMLWKVLRKKYGRDPDHIYPLRDGPSYSEILTHEEDEVINNLLSYLGFHIPLKTSMCRGKNEGFMPSSHEDNLSSSSSSYPREFMNKTSGNFSISFATTMCSYHSDSAPLHNNSSFLSSKDEECSAEVSHFQLSQINKKEKIMKVWDYRAEYGGELYTVRWESALLMDLCDSVTDMAVDLAGVAAKEILKQTVLATLITAIALPYALVNAANMIDGVWTLAIERADIAGVELAKSLLYSHAGNRPVALVGFSMGARAIYSCLKELAHHQDKWENLQNRSENIYVREPASIVEDAILMGTPNHISIPSWKACRQVVAGRLINCYSQKDLILSVMFQFKRLAGGLLRPVTGSSPVNVMGVENFDVGHLINTHSDYCLYAGSILRYVRHGQPHRPSYTLLQPVTKNKNVIS